MPKSYTNGFDETYCYPNTHVLKNKLNITNKNELHNAEQDLICLRILEIEQAHGIPGKFDTQHLKMIHKHIFQDIYEWAGKFRTVDIAKGNMFCRTKFIESQMNNILNELKHEQYLKNTENIDEMSKRLSYYLSEINAIHPFREGNGRTQRAFIKQLAYQAGYCLDLSRIPDGALLKASIASFNCDYTKMNEVMRCALTKR